MSKRRLGYPQRSFDAITGSDNTQNARPDLHMMESNRGKLSPLFPHYQVNSPEYYIANKGEIGFVVIDKGTEVPPYPGFQMHGSYSDTIDSVHYVPALNGLGDMSEVGPNESRSQAQTRWRDKINVVGICHDDIQAQPNLHTKGNTLVTGKGKITMPNTGVDEICDGDQICWDICTEDLYPRSGLTKLKFERDRYSLFVAKANTPRRIIDGITKAINDPDNWDAPSYQRDYLIKTWTGLCQIALVLVPYVSASAHINGSTTFQDFLRNSMIFSLDDSQLQRIETDLNRIYSVVDNDRDAFTKLYKAALPEHSHAGNGPKGYMGKRVETFKSITSRSYNYPKTFLITDYNATRKPSTANPTKHELVNKADSEMLDLVLQMNGALDNTLMEGQNSLLRGLAGITQSEHRRMLGTAVTPASIGYDFDLILHY